ncbi:flap endonuclease 1-like [Halichondria panicea]|uniref:flap endonuclease 1-like n=1 Tax=Halichondria panicea TaxID=6063 RepID=UPI00312BB346
MGIHGLMKLIGDYAPSAMKDGEIKTYFGRKVAVDASMSLYQFLIAVRMDGSQLTDSDGDTTSHLIGFFYRTIRMLENGIKPVYVFDGKPPEMKSGELLKRSEKRAEAEKGLVTATDKGDQEQIEKFQKRLVKVTPKHVEECKRLLTLMGVPFVAAPCEAEAQCASMVKAGLVYATATEDMDCLTFGSSVMLRHLTASEAKKMPVREIHLEKLLAELGVTQQEFIDLCILLGCDYCDSVKGVGPAKAITLIRDHKNIEEIIEKGKKLNIPENWLYQEARRLFKEPEVMDPKSIELKWSLPDEAGLVKFLAEEKGFAEDRIRKGAAKLVKSKSSSTQGRLDSFFTPLASPVGQKRKREDTGKLKGPLKKKPKAAATGAKFRRK